MVDTYACGIQMERSEEDLYELLGLDAETTTRLSVLRLFRDTDLTELPAAKRYAVKAFSDPYYHQLYRRTRSTRALFEAGFFDDHLPKLAQNYTTFSSNFTCTSIQKAAANLEFLKPKNPAILVTTGGMAPIHNGHIEMMEKAKRMVEARGFTVIGGYLAPGHDSYVGQKYQGTAAIPASHRVAMVELATQDSDWLDVDPWAALYMPAEVNFTDVVERLVYYLHDNLSLPSSFSVFYVCGSDNAGFVDAIPHRVVVVDRTGSSSKQAREGDHSHLNPLVRDYLLGINGSTGTLPYLIRNEEDEAIKSWAGIMPGGQEELTKRRIQLQSTVRLGIAQMFKSQGQEHKVHLLPLSQQRIKAEEVIAGRSTISLDPFFPSTYSIDSTRYFALAGAQTSPLFRAERAGFKKLEEQARDIPPGSYVMVEDDSVTGGTIMSAMALLPHGVQVEEVVLLSDFADYQDDSYYDVVDLRDFIVGSHCGGLSIDLPRGTTRARAPYVAPFVSLRSRAKIPPEVELEISRIIWQANVRFFEGSGILIQDCDPGFQALASYLTFQPDELVETFCRFYADALMEIV